MPWLIYVFAFFMLITSATQSHAQFWKKKTHYTKSTSGKITKPDGGEYRDAFKRKSNKGPNIKTHRKPVFKTKKSMHKFSTSRKTKKAGSKKFFKAKYSQAKYDSKAKDTFSRNARKTKKKAKKGGGKSNGVFKGRKR